MHSVKLLFWLTQVQLQATPRAAVAAEQHGSSFLHRYLTGPQQDQIDTCESIKLIGSCLQFRAKGDVVLSCGCLDSVKIPAEFFWGEIGNRIWVLILQHAEPLSCTYSQNRNEYWLSMILFTLASNFYLLAGVSFMIGGCEIHSQLHRCECGYELRWFVQRASMGDREYRQDMWVLDHDRCIWPKSGVCVRVCFVTLIVCASVEVSLISYSLSSSSFPQSLSLLLSLSLSLSFSPLSLVL